MKKLIPLFSLLIILLFPLQTKAINNAKLVLNVNESKVTYTIGQKYKPFYVNSTLYIDNKPVDFDITDVYYEFDFKGKELPYDFSLDNDHLLILPLNSGTFNATLTAIYKYDPIDFERTGDPVVLRDETDVIIKVKPLNKMYLSGGIESYSYLKKLYTVRLTNCTKYPITIYADGWVKCSMGDQYTRQIKKKKVVLKKGQTKTIKCKVKGNPVYAHVRTFGIEMRYKYKNKNDYYLIATNERLYYWTGSKWKKMGKYIAI